MGYHRAGFEVVGVDIKPQPHYPFEFVQADALDILGQDVPALVTVLGASRPGAVCGSSRLRGARSGGRPGSGVPAVFDAIHASPPCQAYSVMRDVRHSRQNPDLVGPTRDALDATQLPYVIENVPGSPLRAQVMLCGSMFGLKSGRGYLRRHRYFEMNWSISELLPPCQHVGLAIGVYGHGSAGHLGQRMRTANRDEARILMGTPDMHRDGMSQAIPPAYTEWIGRQLLSAVTKVAA
jgi:DNA (cytosine-5)-methyltransferase 1